MAASAFQPKSVLASSDALRLREFAQLSIIGALVLLSPVLALLAAIAVEIAIDILLQAGGPPLPACVAAGAIGWLVLHQARAPPRGRSSRNMRRCPIDAAQWQRRPRRPQLWPLSAARCRGRERTYISPGIISTERLLDKPDHYLCERLFLSAKAGRETKTEFSDAKIYRWSPVRIGSRNPG